MSLQQLPNELKQQILSNLDLPALQSVRLVDHDLKDNALRAFQIYFRTQVLLLIPEKLNRLAEISDHKDFHTQVHEIVVVFGNFQAGTAEKILSNKLAVMYERDLEEQVQMKQLGLDFVLLCRIMSGLQKCRRMQFHCMPGADDESQQKLNIRCGGVRRINLDLFPIEESMEETSKSIVATICLKMVFDVCSMIEKCFINTFE
jgi:hypothetical protein